MQAHDPSEHAHHERDALHNKAGESKTRWVVAITAVMMIGELIIGKMTGSLALTADGWHMGTHVGALGLSLAAYWYARRHAGNDTFSFGTGKVYALAGYTSGVLLGLVAIWMIVEGVERLTEHPPINFGEALPIAALGLVVNLVSAKLLSHDHTYGHGHSHGHGHDHDHDHAPPKPAGSSKFVVVSPSAIKLEGVDLSSKSIVKSTPKPGTLDFNLRAAYIHILADAMTSVLAIIALALGRYAGLWFMDPIMGFIGAGVILWWTASLCKLAMRQLLDVVSSPDHEALVRRKLEAIDDVQVADLHVWELGPGKRSCIVSIVTATPRELEYYRRVVLDALEVAHLTIEIHRCTLPHEELAPAQVAHSHPH